MFLRLILRYDFQSRARILYNTGSTDRFGLGLRVCSEEARRASNPMTSTSGLPGLLFG